MNEQTKSIIRHLLTALGVVLGFVGLSKFTGLLDILNQNLDTVWNAALTIVGFATTLIGFFKNKDRFGTVDPNEPKQ
jgi:hypothetical protein